MGTTISTYPIDQEGYRVFTLEYAQDAQGHTHLKMWVTKTYEETFEDQPNVEYPKPGMPEDMVKDFDHSFNGKKINAKLNVAIGGNLGGKGPYFWCVEILCTVLRKERTRFHLFVPELVS